jgi:hypothetical protein
MAVVLSPVARTKLSSYIADIARANNVEDARHTFAVQPVPEQKLLLHTKKSADFLNKLTYSLLIMPKAKKSVYKLGHALQVPQIHESNRAIQFQLEI